MKFIRIKDNDIANGVGITMSLWTQGCPHHCKGCFNTETWDFNKGKEFTELDLKYIFDNINKNDIHRDLSILGGEPLCPQNIEGVINLCKEFKKIYPNKKIYIWTGYTLEEFNDTEKSILKYIDLKIKNKKIEEKRNLSLKLRGSENQRVINVKETLKNKKIILI